MPGRHRLAERRRYQTEVARLLERIDGQTRRRRLLEAAGAKAAALAAVERETERARRRLAALVEARPGEALQGSRQ